jgi:hypothetical protein
MLAFRRILFFGLKDNFILYSSLVPCSLAKCATHANQCINHAFKAECVCDYGYQGDGVNYCDGKRLRPYLSMVLIYKLFC